jgi:RND family efflux transporter MFP subunit
MNRDRSKTAAALAALASLVTVAVTWLWAHEGHAPLPTRGVAVDGAAGQLVVSGESRAALDIRTAQVEKRPVPETVLAQAVLTAPWQQHAYVTSRLGGRVKALLVQPGQTVAAGQVLAEVESLDLEDLQLEVRNAWNALQLADKVAKGLTEASRSGAVPVQSLLEAHTTQRQSANALDVLRARWASLGLPSDTFEDLRSPDRPRLLPTLPVRSPLAGTVVHADLTVGRRIEPAQHLFEVVNLNTVWVRIGVLEKDLGRVVPGQPVELRLSAYPGEVFRTNVRIDGQYLDPQTHLNAVWADLANPANSEPRFLPGMAGQARLELGGADAVTAVPADALLRDAGDSFVLVEEAQVQAGSQYRRKRVVLGRQSADWVEIVSGEVYPGDRVVTRGGRQLAAFFAAGVLRPGPEAARNMGLRVEPAQERVVEDVLEIDGAVEVPPDHRAALATPFAGVLETVHVGPGQHVAANQVVAEVTSVELHNLELDFLRSHLEEQLLAERLHRLRDNERTVPERSLLEADSRLRAVRNQRDALKRKLLTIGLSDRQVDDLAVRRQLVCSLPLRSPIAGVVVRFDRVVGQALKAEETVVEVHDLSGCRVRGQVGQADVGRVHLGQQARVRLLADPSATGAGRVVRSGRVLGIEERALSIWVDLDSQPKRAGPPWRHDQLVRLTLVLGRDMPCLAVPLSAVVREGSRAFVFVRQPEGVFERRLIKTGRADDRFVAITSGLRPGELLAVQGVAQLQAASAGLQ